MCVCVWVGEGHGPLLAALFRGHWGWLGQGDARTWVKAARERRTTRPFQGLSSDSHGGLRWRDFKIHGSSLTFPGWGHVGWLPRSLEKPYVQGIRQRSMVEVEFLKSTAGGRGVGCTVFVAERRGRQRRSRGLRLLLRHRLPFVQQQWQIQDEGAEVVILKL